METQEPVTFFWKTPIPLKINNLSTIVPCNVRGRITANRINNNHTTRKIITNRLQTNIKIAFFVSSRNGNGELRKGAIITVANDEDETQRNSEKTVERNHNAYRGTYQKTIRSLNHSNTKVHYWEESEPLEDGQGFQHKPSISAESG